MGFKSKLRNFKEGAVNSMIYNTYYNEDLDEKLVYLESRDGLDFTGNIFRIVEELSNGNYDDLKIHVHAKPHVVDKIKDYQKNYNLHIDKIITKEANATKTLEKAKYIFTDSGIRPKYVKREGQIVINTWHGTPLKIMGWDNRLEQHLIGNAQHALLSSDYLLYPNDYMCSKMMDAYMISEIFSGDILLEGYPRNSVFFKAPWLKDKLNLNDYEIFAYMPTYRGVFHSDNSNSQISDYLDEMDLKLNDNQILFVKLHIFDESQIDFSKFSHIRVFPKEYETYDVLNMADVLITDYSSVFFDFANSRRKIILFNYDEDDYESYRGFYFPLSDLPFPKVKTTDDLIEQLNSPKDYDDSDFIRDFCTYDNEDAGRKLCEFIFAVNNDVTVKKVSNAKENVLIYMGDNIDCELLSGLNTDDYNFYVSYRQWSKYIAENHLELFRNIPSEIKIMPLRFDLTPMRNENLKSEKLLKRSFIKQYGSVDFKAIVNLNPADENERLIFENSGIEIKDIDEYLN